MEGCAADRGLFQEMDLDEGFISQWMINSYESIGETLPMAAAFPDNDHLHYRSLLYDDHQLPIKSTPSSDQDYCPIYNRQTKQLNVNSWGSFIVEPTPSPEPYNNFSATSTVFHPLSPSGQFTDLNRLDHHPVWNYESTYAMESGQRAMSKAMNMSASGRANPIVKDHVIAERKRREKLNQMFIALSAVIPGLKKTDKASVLTDAVSYIKQLQERVKTLEDQNGSKTAESVVLVKKSKLLIDDSCIKGEPDDEVEVLEIEARVCHKDVRIRVHCENKKGVTEKVLSEISKLNLTVGNTSVFTFGSSTLDITIVAQMDAKCSMTMKELVKTLRVGFKSFM